MPFTKVVRKATKERPEPLPTTIGDHVRKVRRERRLLQREVAEAVGVAPVTVANWETGKTEPQVSDLPAVMRFLGYEPWPAPTTVQQRMFVFRARAGLSIKAAALLAGVDEGSWATWERTGQTPLKRCLLLLTELLPEASGTEVAL